MVKNNRIWEKPETSLEGRLKFYSLGLGKYFWGVLFSQAVYRKVIKWKKNHDPKPTKRESSFSLGLGKPWSDTVPRKGKNKRKNNKQVTKISEK